MAERAAPSFSRLDLVSIKKRLLRFGMLGKCRFFVGMLQRTVLYYMLAIKERRESLVLSQAGQKWEASESEYGDTGAWF